MYDYNNARFLSVDPFIQAPTSTQSMNPYTYIFNNPLSGTDPTGYLIVVNAGHGRDRIISCGPNDTKCEFDKDIQDSNGRSPDGSDKENGVSVSDRGNQNDINFTPSEENQFAQNDDSKQQSQACEFLGNHPSCKSSKTRKTFDDISDGIETTGEVLDAATEPDLLSAVPLLGPIKKADNINDARKATKGLKISNELKDASRRVGIDLEKLKIVDGVAEIKIDFSETLKLSDIKLIKEFVKLKGARTLNVESGFIGNDALDAILENKFIFNRNFKGGRVDVSPLSDSDYRIIFDL